LKKTKKTQIGWRVYFVVKIEKTVFTLLWVSSVGSGSCFTLLNQHLRQLITLPLASKVGAETLLQEFQSALILGHTQQFHGSSFVGRKAGNFTHNTANEFVVLCQSLEMENVRQNSKRSNVKATYSFLGDWSILVALIFGHFMALVQTLDGLVTSLCHCCLCKNGRLMEKFQNKRDKLTKTENGKQQ